MMSSSARISAMQLSIEMTDCSARSLGPDDTAEVSRKSLPRYSARWLQKPIGRLMRFRWLLFAVIMLSLQPSPALGEPANVPGVRGAFALLLSPSVCLAEGNVVTSGTLNR